MKLTPQEIKNAISEHESKIQELQEELKKSSYITGFEGVDQDVIYFSIDNDGEVKKMKEDFSDYDERVFNIANYGSEKRMNLLEKMNRLQRLMYRFSAENGGDEIKLNNFVQPKWFIRYILNKKTFEIDYCFKDYCIGEILFVSENVTQQALEKFRPLMQEIIKEEQEVRDYYLELNSKEKLTSSYGFAIGRKFIVDGLEYEIYHIEETENGTEYHIEHDEGDDDEYYWDIHSESELEKIILRGSFDE